MSHGDGESSESLAGRSSRAKLASIPPRSRAFITAVNASLCGLAGLVLGGYGVDLVRWQRPDFHYGTMLAAAIVGGLGWCAGALVYMASREIDPVRELRPDDRPTGLAE